jgi:hypothetical protein
MNISGDSSIVFLVYSHLVEVPEEKQHGEKVINSLWDENKQYIFERKTKLYYVYFFWKYEETDNSY